SSGLDGEGFFYPRSRIGDLLELFQSLDIRVQSLSSRSRSGSGKSVCRRDQHSFHALRLVIAVVSSHAVDNGLGFLISSEHLDTNIYVRTLDLMVKRLAYVVQQAGSLGQLDVQAQLAGHQSG